MLHPADELVERYRQRWACGPVGVWRTPHEFDEDYGSIFVFDANFTGVVTFWDTGIGEYEQIPFEWRTFGPRVIEVNEPSADGYPGGWRAIHYDFEVGRDGYWTDRIVMRELNRSDREPGFWLTGRGVHLCSVDSQCAAVERR